MDDGFQDATRLLILVTYGRCRLQGKVPAYRTSCSCQLTPLDSGAEAATAVSETWAKNQISIVLVQYCQFRGWTLSIGIGKMPEFCISSYSLPPGGKPVRSTLARPVASLHAEARYQAEHEAPKHFRTTAGTKGAGCVPAIYDETAAALPKDALRADSDFDKQRNWVELWHENPQDRDRNACQVLKDLGMASLPYLKSNWPESSPPLLTG